MTLYFDLTQDLDLGFLWSNVFDSHILGMGRSIDLEWKRCELYTMLLDAQWVCSWATVHGKYIGQVMGRCETVTVSKLLALEWAVHSLIWGLRGGCRSSKSVPNSEVRNVAHAMTAVQIFIFFENVCTSCGIICHTLYHKLAENYPFLLHFSIKVHHQLNWLNLVSFCMA